MKNEIRVLMLEDDPVSATLVEGELCRGGLNSAVRRVETKQEFMAELERHVPDLILSDHGLPAFDGFSALDIARAECPEVPFIFVTGRNDEEEVVEALKRGAIDYVFKERLSRLSPAVHRALSEAEVKKKLPERRGGAQEPHSLPVLCLDALFALRPGE